MTSSTPPPDPGRPPTVRNLFADRPPAGPDEHFDTLLNHPQARIERILSHRHASPPDFWYEQPGDEWVLLVHGSATLEFDNGQRTELRPGDWLTLPAGCRHRVAATGPDTVWLAVHLSRGSVSLSG